MPAYWVARARISDPIEYKTYTDRVPAIIAPCLPSPASGPQAGEGREGGGGEAT